MAPQPRDRPTNPSVRWERAGPLARRCGPAASASFPKRLAGKLPDSFGGKTVLPLPQNPYGEAPRRNPPQNRLRASPKPIRGSCETLSCPNPSSSFPITLSGKLPDATDGQAAPRILDQQLVRAGGQTRQTTKPSEQVLCSSQTTNHPQRCAKWSTMWPIGLRLRWHRRNTLNRRGRPVPGFMRSQPRPTPVEEPAPCT